MEIYILCSILPTPPKKKREIVWKNMVELDRPQMSV